MSGEGLQALAEIIAYGGTAVIVIMPIMLFSAWVYGKFVPPKYDEHWDGPW